LTYLAESVHEDIPVEELAPILKHLIDQFVGEHCVEDKIVLFLKLGHGYKHYKRNVLQKSHFIG
jgi:hypothetical protein